MLTKYASAVVLDARLAPRSGGLMRDAHRHDFAYTPREGYLYVRSRAISSRTNDNFDNFPAEEIKKAYQTFIGKPVFVNHHNDNHRRARGVIVDAALHEDRNADGSPDTWAEVLMEVDAIRFPKLAQAIIAGEIDRTSMGCFVPGTLITLADGTQKPIDSVVLGDEVLTHTGKTEPVTYVMERDYDGIVYDIRTFGQASPLVMTDEHPVWVKRPAQSFSDVTGRKVRSLDVEVCTCGKEMASWRSLTAHVRESKRRGWEGVHEIPQGSRETVGWIEARDVQPGDWVLTPTPDDEDSHPGSYPFARLLGFYLAEGNLGWDRKRRPEGPVSVEWSFDAGGFKDEIEHVEEIVNLLGAMGYTAAGPYEKGNAYSIRCNSPELADRFLAYGGKYSWAKRVLPEVLHWSRDNQRTLVEAYLLGDAHFRDGHFEAGTASKQMAQQLQLMAVRAGIAMTPPVRQHSPSTISAGHRPKYVMQGSLELKPTRVTQQERARLAVVAPEGLWRRVTDIVMKTYRGKVYNFDVEGDDSYVAADTAVHNCDVAFSICSACGNKATNPTQYCQHIPRLKGKKIRRVTASGSKEDVLVYESCYGLGFFENSLLVEQPADPTAATLGIYDHSGIDWSAKGLQTAASKISAGSPDIPDDWSYVRFNSHRSRDNFDRSPHGDKAIDLVSFEAEPITAVHPDALDHIQNSGGNAYKGVTVLKRKPDLSKFMRPLNDRHAKIALDQVVAPAKVDTLRDTSCPVCNEDDSYNGDKCLVCGFIKPPDEFLDPDLEKAKQVDLRQDQQEDPALQTQDGIADPDPAQAGIGQDGADPSHPWLNKEISADQASSGTPGKPWEQKEISADAVSGDPAVAGNTEDPDKPWLSKTLPKTSAATSRRRSTPFTP